MSRNSRTTARIQLTLTTLLCSLPVLAVDPETPQRYTLPSWHEPPPNSFWWIFPLFFIVMMVVMFVLMGRSGGMSGMWRPWMMERLEARVAIKNDWIEHSESALEILDRRYAKGEIDKQEYEEKKATLTHTE